MKKQILFVKWKDHATKEAKDEIMDKIEKYMIMEDPDVILLTNDYIEDLVKHDKIDDIKSITVGS